MHTKYLFNNLKWQTNLGCIGEKCKTSCDCVFCRVSVRAHFRVLCIWVRRMNEWMNEWRRTDIKIQASGNQEKDIGFKCYRQFKSLLVFGRWADLFCFVPFCSVLFYSLTDFFISIFYMPFVSISIVILYRNETDSARLRACVRVCMFTYSLLACCVHIEWMRTMNSTFQPHVNLASHPFFVVIVVLRSCSYVKFHCS